MVGFDPSYLLGNREVTLTPELRTPFRPYGLVDLSLTHLRGKIFCVDGHKVQSTGIGTVVGLQ